MPYVCLFVFEIIWWNNTFTIRSFTKHKFGTINSAWILYSLGVNRVCMKNNRVMNRNTLFCSWTEMLLLINAFVPYGCASMRTWTKSVDGSAPQPNLIHYFLSWMWLVALVCVCEKKKKTLSRTLAHSTTTISILNFSHNTISNMFIFNKVYYETIFGNNSFPSGKCIFTYYSILWNQIYFPRCTRASR